MSVRTSAGTTLKISAAAPATFDAAGYAALTFTNVAEITDLGEFGREYALVTHNPIGSRGTVKKKGSFNEGTMALKLGLDTDDAGQILIKAASLSDNDYSFQITSQNGDKYYFQAQVMNFKVGLSTVDAVTSASVNLELTSSSAGVGVIEVLAA
ncbi:hypothetical protein C8R31_101665 [Nitrosospira sp. Nsp2]|uniref:hypothetical protein n=1 Tax=Nitrosospira sp. Nsp2 TaxID=136548 RepID=UPI000D317E5F|nr:hypothetical protein [Nitrosospira sp. Nsp2]PTR17501.1 hypothetical protein C8R31_101665 [Nitrosospira sp. Nsp2]